MEALKNEISDIKKSNLTLIKDNHKFKEKLETSKNKIHYDTKETLNTNENADVIKEVNLNLNLNKK